MTQAFNLSQFANKVNTSGQADLTTAVTGVLPTANGGTGLSSPGASGNVLRSNGSVWTSAALADYSGDKGAVYDTGAVFTASKATTVLTVTAVQKGTLYVGQTITCVNAGVLTTMTISSLGTGTGGTGTYNVSVSGTITARQWGGGNSGTWAVPTGITAVKVTVVGGGGNGGVAGANAATGGGGGGGTVIKYFTGLSGGSFSFVIGAPSGTSSATYSATTISATGGSIGGSGAGVGATSVGGTGGIGSGGDMNFLGQKGGTVYGLAFGCSQNNLIDNYGGNSAIACGAGAPSAGGAAVGINCLSGGGGGSGACSLPDGTTRSGGSGSPGIVIFEY